MLIAHDTNCSKIDFKFTFGITNVFRLLCGMFGMKFHSEDGFVYLTRYSKLKFDYFVQLMYFLRSCHILNAYGSIHASLCLCEYS